MSDLQLYTLVVASASQTELRNQQRQELAQAGVLDQDGGVAEQLSSNPGDQTLNGVYRGRFAEKMATEIDELSSAAGFEAVPLAGIDGSTPIDGYYVVEEADVRPAQAQTGNAQRYDLTLTEMGTRNSHWRAVETNRRQVDHDWGNDLDALVGVPATAGKVQWYNPDDGSKELASPVNTHSAELGDVEIYDLNDGEAAVGTSNPTLLYEISYREEENTDCRVYDTRGHGSKLDTDGNLQWQKVFSTQHDFDDELVFDTGRLRLRPDEGAGTLEAEEWDATNEVWSDVGLTQPSTTELFDVDLTSITMLRDQAQLTFDVDGSLYALDAILHAGHEDVLFAIPENESGPIPTDLQDWLSPIASTTIVDPQATKTLVSRREVRK